MPLLLMLSAIVTDALSAIVTVAYCYPTISATAIATVLSAIVTATYCYPTTSVPIVTFMTLFIFTAYSLYLISC